jgi:hypothetical protein
MTRALLAASWRAVGRPPLLVLVGVAVLLTLATVPYLDDGYADRVRLGVAMLLACAWASTADDPASEVAASSPEPRWRRCAARMVVGLCVVLPVAVLTLALGEVQAGETPFSGAALQVLGVMAIGPALGFGMWAWAGLPQPAYAATVGVLCCTLAMWLLPAAWSVVSVQTWGPPWEAALLRWTALAVFGLAVMATAWRDPLARS